MEEKKKIEPHKSSLFDLDANYVAVAAYVGGAGFSLTGGSFSYFTWLIPVLIYMLEKKSSFVKDHAKQAIGLAFLSLILSIIADIIRRAVYGNVYNWFNGTSGLFFLIDLAIALIIGFLGVVAIMRTLKYKNVKIPFANAIAKLVGPILDKISVKANDMINKDDDDEKNEEKKVEEKEETDPVQKN